MKNSNSRTMKLFPVSLFLIVFMVTVTQSVLSQELDSTFLGVWSNGKCPAINEKLSEGEFPFLLVEKGGYHAHETRCKFTKTDKSSQRLIFQCYAEGDSFDQTEEWKISLKRQTVSGWSFSSKFLTITKGGYPETYRECPYKANRIPDPDEKRWTPDQLLAGTKWIYNEEWYGKKLNQCQISGEFEAVNGASNAKITVAVLAWGRIVIGIQDAELAKRVNMDFGWRDGYEFDNTQIRFGKGQVQARGLMQPGLYFLLWPTGEEQSKLKKGFFSSERFLLTINGLTAKAFRVPRLNEAWKTLRNCRLLGSN